MIYQLRAQNVVPTLIPTEVDAIERRRSVLVSPAKCNCQGLLTLTEPVVLPD